VPRVCDEYQTRLPSRPVVPSVHRWTRGGRTVRVEVDRRAQQESAVERGPDLLLVRHGVVSGAEFVPLAAQQSDYNRRARPVQSTGPKWPSRGHRVFGRDRLVRDSRPGNLTIMS